MSKYKFKYAILASASARPSAVLANPRADASDQKAMFEQINAAVKEMRNENDLRLAKGEKADVLHAEKIDRIQDSIDKLQLEIDDNTKKINNQNFNGSNGGRKIADPEYNKAFNAHMRRGDVQASMNKGAAAEGGFFAPIEWDRTVGDKLVRISPMRQLAKVQQISGNSFTKLFNLKGTVSGWVGETTARPETATVTVGSLQYDTGEIYSNPSATQLMLDDSLVDIEQWLEREVQQEFALQEGKAFISGTGANNRPRGILTYVTGGTNATAHPYGAITTVNSGAAATVTADGLINLVYDLPSEFTAGANFLMSRTTQRVVRLLKDLQNNYLWQPSYVAGQPSTLLGYGLYEDPEMPNLAAASKSVLFGDFSLTYLVIDRVGIRLLRDPYTNKPFVMFYTTKRVGGGLLNPETMRALNTAA
jgi:HK97 family phage major capsid protein